MPLLAGSNVRFVAIHLFLPDSRCSQAGKSGIMRSRLRRHRGAGVSHPLAAAETGRRN
jgi:hypothetical protein